MDARISHRLAAVYPHGDIDQPAMGAVLGEAELSRVQSALARACAPNEMTCIQGLLFPRDRVWAFAITERAGPSQVEWCRLWATHGNAEKLAWVARNRRPFPILWVKVSRVFPIYWLYYNLWTPRGDTGILDAVIADTPPSKQWFALHPDLHQSLHAAGAVLLSDAEAAEECESLFEEVYEDAEGNELPDEVPPRRVPVSLHRALFPISV